MLSCLRYLATGRRANDITVFLQNIIQFLIGQRISFCPYIDMILDDLFFHLACRYLLTGYLLYGFREEIHLSG